MYTKAEVIEIIENVISEGYRMNDDGEIFHPERKEIEATEDILNKLDPVRKPIK